MCSIPGSYGDGVGSAYCVAVIQLCELLHLVLVQSSGHLSHSVREDGYDLMEDCEHGLWDDLQDLCVCGGAWVCVCGCG